MGFVVPVMPLNVKIWRWSNWMGVIPPVSGPTLTSPANLACGSVGNFMIGNYGAIILLPAGTDIRWSESGTNAPGTFVDADLVEVDFQIHRFYRVGYVNDLGRGFSNYHRFAEIEDLPPTAMPLV
jgi:hypothetical protein